MKRSVVLFLLLPILLFVAYGVYLYISTNGTRWNPIDLPASLTTRNKTSEVQVATVSPPIEASMLNLPLPAVTATSTPQPTIKATPSTTPTKLQAPTITVTPSPTITSTPTNTATPVIGSTVPDQLRKYCKTISEPRFEWYVLRSACEMVTGEVLLAFADSPPAGDGDYEFYLKPDPGQMDFLAPGNESLGAVIPSEIPAEALDMFTELPQTGMKVLILGSWVQNTNRRDWSEFNPVWYWFELP